MTKMTKMTKPKTLLICHAGARLDQEGLARWLASFSDLTGIILLQETLQQLRQRIQRQLKRTGWMRFCDVLAFRLYYRAVWARHDARWEEQTLQDLRHTYPVASACPVLTTHSPNSPEAEAFIRQCQPDVMIARCQSLLKERIFSLPTTGTFVLHPGICPEYRNSHGCFWALVNGERDKVGMTLLCIDEGVDTGPVFGYFFYEGDAAQESHIVIQERVVFEHLPAIQQKLLEIFEGKATPIATDGRASATWEQPWLTRYWQWKRRARKYADDFAYLPRHH
jgi:hypothetical protein